MIHTDHYDALIAGGGPAGSTVAIALAQVGRRVIVIEKTREAQHKVCGEFLSPESMPLLRQIGIDPITMGAQTIHSARLAARDVIAEIRLPEAALSLTRRALDEALLERARQAGADVLRGCSVESLSRHAHGISQWCARLRTVSDDESSSVEARGAFLATGKHDLRGWARNASGVQGKLVAMKTYCVLAPGQASELAGHIELFLFPGGYGGLQPVEDGCANLCWLVTRDRLRVLGGNWERLLDHMQQHSAHLARRLSGARFLVERPLALSAIPYGYCAPVPDNDAALWRVGDQAAVIPSFSGDGMSIALHTAMRAAQLYLDGAPSPAFHVEVRDEFQQRLRLATAISRLAIAAPLMARAVRFWPSILSRIFAATRAPRGFDIVPEQS